MSINPYASVFLTSVCSKAGFHNDYVATHPFYNNWVVIILFGVLFLFTLIVKPVMATNKLTGILVATDNYLEGKAAILINIIVMVLPMVLGTNVEPPEMAIQMAGMLSFGIKTVLVLILSTYVLFVVMTIRLFIDFLIYLSPLPMVDTVVQVLKVVVSGGLVVLSIVSPMLSVLVLGMMFLVSLVFYRRARRLINRLTYLLVDPVLSLFKKSTNTLDENGLKVYCKTGTSTFRKGSLVRLMQQDGKPELRQSRFLFSNKTEPMTDEPLFEHQKALFTELKNESESFIVLINRTKRQHVDTISQWMKIERQDEPSNEKQSSGSWCQRFKGLFQKSDLEDLKVLESNAV